MGPTLFKIFANGLYDCICKFPQDTNLGGVVDAAERVVLPFRGTSAGWINGRTETS